MFNFILVNYFLFKNSFFIVNDIIINVFYVFHYRSKKPPQPTILNKNSKIPLPVNLKLTESNEINIAMYR
jgi:hypothetical protein